MSLTSDHTFALEIETMSHTLNEIFTCVTDEETGACAVGAYSPLLDRIVCSCPDANIVLESQQYSRVAAIQQGNCSIWEPAEVAGEELPFNPEEVGVQITYLLDRRENRWDLAWVATWPYE